MKIMLLSCLKLVTMLSISGASTMDDSELSSKKNSNKKSLLQGSGAAANNDVFGRELNAIYCGCPGCNTPAFGVYAGAYTCGGRITYLQNSGFSERDACAKIAGDEFPTECGVCDPDSCNSSSSPPLPPPPPPSTGKCGCSECEDAWDTMAGDYSCGVRIEWLQSPMSTIVGGPYEESVSCSKVASEEYPSECGKCDPSRCNDPLDITTSVAPPNNNVSSGQKCGGAVDSSINSETICERDLWNPTGDSTMHCFAYGGSGDPCHLSNNNDPDDGIFKDPSACLGDTFYLWDEPDVQKRSYNWAGRTWLDYSERFPQELLDLRAMGTKVTSPLLKAGGPGVLMGNLRDFYDACGPPCTDPFHPAYIDVIAINAFCNDINPCRAGAAYIYDQSVSLSGAFNNIPVYITNWAMLQTSNPQDQVAAIDAIEEFFPSSTNPPIVERVYWFGAKDYGGNSKNNYLTQILADGSTLGERWRSKCDSL